MKRYLVLFLLLALLIPCMTLSASATTQGVIDAIDDLSAGLGTSQGDIRDLLSYISDVLDGISDAVWDTCNNVVTLVDDIMIPIRDDILGPMLDYMESIYGYFFTTRSVYQYRVAYSSTDGFYKKGNFCKCQ